MDIVERLRATIVNETPARYPDVIEAAIAAIERLRAALNEIDSWSRAYPMKVFPEPDHVKAAKLLAAGGMTLDAISADAMRHCLKEAGEIARKALSDEQRVREE